jgi:hypothetical protein
MHNKNEIVLIDIDDLSSKMKMSKRWIREQVNLADSPMPHYRPGQRLRFYYPKVLDWLDAKTKEKL